MSPEELRGSLTETLGAVADARAYVDRAQELLAESQRIVVDAQAQARPWLPTQLARALEQLDTQRARLHEVNELIDRYQARL